MKKLDLMAWLKANRRAPEPAPAPAPQPARREPGHNRINKYAVAAMAKEVEVLAGTTSNRNIALNRAAVALGELIGAGELTRAEVERELTGAAVITGLDLGEIGPTLASGLDHGIGQPRHLGHVGTPPAPPGKPPRDGGGGGGGDDGGGDDDDCARREEYADNPHELARIFRGDRYNHPDGWKLRYWSSGFHIWAAGAYRPVPSEDIRAQVTEAVADELAHHNIIAGNAWRMGPKKEKPPRPIPVTRRLVGDVLQALGGLSLLSTSDHPDQPCWIDGEASWPPEECVPMKNAIVHLPSLAKGLPCTRKPTPRFFCPYVLGYNFEPEAPPPARWLAFTKSIFPNDQQSIDTLQEWMGLQLVPDLRYEKIMALIGPMRAGKGTIAEVITALVGSENMAAPTLTSLSDKFGLKPLIGKLSAIIDDAHLSQKSDHAVITERLKSISGAGRITSDRKYKDEWTGQISARITMITNELPRLGDNSSALPNRFIVLRFTESFLGREDLELKADLRKELPGIFMWAVEGWKRLRERGRFIQPDAGVEEHRLMKELASPVSSFLNQCCVVDPHDWAPCAEVYAAWRAWSDANGFKDAGTAPVFSRNLHSVITGVKTSQKRVPGGGMIRVFKGLSLIPPASLFADDGDAREPAPGEYAEGGFDFGDSA